MLWDRAFLAVLHYPMEMFVASVGAKHCWLFWLLQELSSLEHSPFIPLRPDYED